MGTSRGAHDLITAGHAAETGRTIRSHDAKARFGDRPGVNAISDFLLLRLWRMGQKPYYAGFCAMSQRSA
jgi:hypothetical protein